MRHTVYEAAGQTCWLFEPTDPPSASSPLVVFLHGRGVSSPATHGAWIDHLVRRGCIVAYPIYQIVGPESSAASMVATVTGTIKEAIRWQGRRSARPDLDRVAVVGTSVGGMLAAHVAATASQAGLPVPGAVMSVTPAYGTRFPEPTASLQRVSPRTLMLVVAAEDDQNVADRGARMIYVGTSQIPLENKNLVVLRSDYHGTPPLVANHRSPGAANPKYWQPRAGGGPAGGGRAPMGLAPVDALDYHGYWKLLDGLSDAVFHGRNRIYALGDTPQQRFMGTWSDGTPVREPRVITSPWMFWEMRGRGLGSPVPEASVDA